MTVVPDEAVRFGPFVLDGRLRELRRDGGVVPLQRKPMDLLWVLIQKRDRVVPSHELLEHVWPDAHVSDQTLASTLRELRRALGDTEHRLIQTLRGHGYRFTASISQVTDLEAQRACGPAAAPNLRAFPFAGREGDLGRLRSGLERAARGSGSTWVVTGPAGIGKSRLADELVIQARRSGFCVHAGACHSTPGFPPLWVWTELIQSCLATARDDSQRNDWLEAGGAELRCLCLEGGRTHSTDPSFGAKQARFEIAHGIVRLLARAGRESPRLLVIDDQHWADPDSLALLEIVTQLLHELPALLLVTAREYEADRESAAGRALSAVLRARACERIELGGLPPSAVRKLLTRDGHSTPEIVVARVCEMTRGNPLFVTELSRLYREGQLRLAGDGEGTLPVPGAVGDVLQIQLERCRPACQRALRLASVVGEGFSIDVLHRALGESRDALLDALSEAEAAGLIHESEERPGTYVFHHALWREFLYDGFTSVDVRRAHLRVAEALEAIHARDLGPYLATLARHFAEAAPVGGAAKAVRYARQASERADRLWLAMGSAELYAIALGALESTEYADARTRSELHIAHGMHLRLAARRAEGMAAARAAFEAGARFAREAESPDLLARAVVGRVQLELEGFVMLGLGSFVPPVVIENIAAELRAVQAGLGKDDLEAEARILLWLGYTRFCSGDGTEAERLVQQSESISQSLGQTELARETLFIRWALSQAPNRLPERQQIAERLRSLGGGPESPPNMLRNRWLVAVHMETGNVAAAEPLVPDGRDLDPGRPWDDPDVCVWRAMRALMYGRFAQAERQLQSMSQLDSFWIQRARQVQLDWLRVLRGRADEALESAEAAARRLGYVTLTHLWIARCRTELGQTDAARSALARALRKKLEDIAFDQGWLFAHGLAAEVVYRLGESDHAGWIYEHLEPFRGRLIMQAWFVMCRGYIDRSLGLVAATRGSWETSAAHFEAALRGHKRLGATPLVAETQVELARVLIARGDHQDRPKAQALIGHAQRAASRLGMPALAERAKHVIDRG